MATYTLHQGNNIDTLKTYPDNHFDSIVTDPPYGIEFLGKDWDSNTGAIETWQQCYRVLKPGGHLLAFSAARTYHHLATNIEEVGFEIRDQIMWIYGSGFPKAQDVGKAIDKRGVDNDHHGWKTALKPAHEPIVMARKPYKGSCVDNVLKHGVGALNIDATRVPYLDIKDMEGAGLNWNKTGYETGGPRFIGSGEENKPMANPEEKGTGAGIKINTLGRFPSNVMGEIPDYQKYFYCPKVSRAERHIGFETDNIPTNPDGMLTGFYENGESNETGSSYINKPKGAGNNHPTVKPVALMKYLVKLVTPEGGKVLDPFTGSGSTGMAVVELGHEFTGCELDPAYADIARARIQAWYNKTAVSGDTLPSEWFNEVN